jgi:DNA invertase Pin-like site-specific DNA recombinase
VSAYRGKNAEKGALFRFRQDVQHQRISPDSWLLIEDFDRLSRQVFSKVYRLFTEFTDAGITICTTNDMRVYNSANANDLDIVMITMIKVVLGNQENNKKADRLREEWDQRREKGRRTALCPGWIRLNTDGNYEEFPGRWATVRKIFDLAESGLGSTTICKMLNVDPTTPPFAHKHGKRGQKWHTTTINNILTGRAVLGEYQPHKMRDGLPVPYGKPIKNWYPPVISEGQWLRVQDRRKSSARGKRDDSMSNLFLGIIHCIHCDGPMRVKTAFLSKKRTSGRDHRYFVCSNAMLNNGCEGRTYFPLNLVENAILDHTHEYRLHEVFSDPKLAEELRSVEDSIAVKNAEISELEQDTENLKNRLSKYEANDPVGDSLEQTIRTYLTAIEASRKAVETLEQRRLILSNRIDQRTDADGNVRVLRAQVASAEGAELLRLRAKLSQALKAFITGIYFDSIRRGFTVNLAAHGMRSHVFDLVKLKGRSAGQKVEYYSHINFANDEMRLILGLPPKDWNSVRTIVQPPEGFDVEMD